MNETTSSSRGAMPGAGFADIQVQIWEWFQEGKKKEARWRADSGATRLRKNIWPPA